MDIVHIVLLGIITSVIYIILNQVNPSFAFFISLVASLIILVLVVNQIGSILYLLKTLGEKAQINGMYMDTILKIIGIAYIAELGVNLTKDAGLGSVAAKIELAGKIFILVLAVPIITALIEAILSFLPAA